MKFLEAFFLLAGFSPRAFHGRKAAATQPVYTHTSRRAKNASARKTRRTRH